METTNLTTYPTETFTDVSKIVETFGAVMPIYKDKRLDRKCKYRLQNHCCKNQAEQIVILKSLEPLLSSPDQMNRTVAIYTESKLTLHTITRYTIHSELIEEI